MEKFIGSNYFHGMRIGLFSSFPAGWLSRKEGLKAVQFRLNWVFWY